MQDTTTLGSEQFGDFVQFERERKKFELIFLKGTKLPDSCECQKLFIFGSIRRTNSLALAFQQAVDTRNGQMAATLLRLHLDTLARFYTLYWADDTPDLSAEEFAGRVLGGESIRNFEFCEGTKKKKATDSWLIKKIEPLGDWISTVYKNSSGAIHFSDFHIKQFLGQASSRTTQEDGFLLLENISVNPIDTDEDPERYRELKQCFLHITLMLSAAIDERCDRLM